MSASTPQALRFVVYFGPRNFMLLASSFVLDRARAPYRRLAATLMLALRQPLQLDVGAGPCLTTRAALIAPNVPRRRVLALDSDMVTIDFPLRSPEYRALEPLLRDRELLDLDIDRFASLLPDLQRALAGKLPASEMKPLQRRIVEGIAGVVPPEAALHPRIDKALQLIGDLPLAQATREELARRLHLSPSHLSHLFKDQIGCSVGQYARWVAVWRGAALWKQGRPLTEVALEVGFYDLSHLDHAFMDVFGLNPSSVIDPRNVVVLRYD